MIGAETYLDLLGDVPHWAFEITVEVVTTLFAVLVFRPFVRRWIKRHDEEHHHQPGRPAGGYALTWDEAWFDHGVFSCRGKGLVQEPGPFFVHVNGTMLEVTITETWQQAGGEDREIVYGWEATEKGPYANRHMVVEAHG